MDCLNRAVVNNCVGLGQLLGEGGQMGAASLNNTQPLIPDISLKKKCPGVIALPPSLPLGAGTALLWRIRCDALDALTVA